MTVCILSSNKVGRLQSILLVIFVDYHSFEPCQGKHYRCYNHVTGEIIFGTRHTVEPVLSDNSKSIAECFLQYF